ncbi:carboxypeptidase regulatory-like domain-containing protein [Flavobacterium oreochromis]|uniref:Carboxypeptidase regulatory-like domain-containing protein n=1 Tax=Flavobacterium columnare TaxID=996 RepID=A0A246G7F5_9FLAO|nr:carboxypeptidase regulatory-like domain-containing protein [Flavobacterium oreochromis]OWP74403.1 hypothetical protein BWK62_14420 [Flavobacterium oreochromis]
MKKYKILIATSVFLIISCKSREYILIDSVKGCVVDKSNNSPVENVKIFTEKMAFNTFDTITTKKNGLFFIEGMKVYKYKDLHHQLNISYNLFFKNKKYRITQIDIKQSKENFKLKNNVLDTLDLGYIYLEK